MQKKIIALISLLFVVLFFGLPQELVSQSDSIILEDWKRYTGNPFSVWKTREDVSKAHLFTE